MAKSFLSTANSILRVHFPSHSTTATLSPPAYNDNTHHNITINNSTTVPILTRRSLTISLTLTLSFTGNGRFHANAAILETDGNAERLERQASTTETAYLQELVDKLAKVGQAIRDNKLSVASSVLGPSSNAAWVQKANTAFTKLSSSPEEKTEADTLNSSLTSLIASVARRDMTSTKVAFVSAVVALEKWTSLTGLVGRLQGL